MCTSQSTFTEEYLRINNLRFPSLNGILQTIRQFFCLLCNHTVDCSLQVHAFIHDARISQINIEHNFKIDALVCCCGSKHQTMLTSIFSFIDCMYGTVIAADSVAMDYSIIFRWMEMDGNEAMWIKWNQILISAINLLHWNWRQTQQ